MITPLTAFWPPWRFGSNVKSADKAVPEGISEGAVVAEWCFATLVVLGVAAEFVIAARHPSYESWLGWWGAAYADLLVAIGVAGEVFASVVAHVCQSDLTRRSNDGLAEALDRATKADLARAELEAKLLPRMLNQDQWDFVQTLRGKFSIIAIAFEVDAETQWFVGHIRDAFFAAGISVAMYPRAAEVHTFGGILIYEPKGFDGALPRSVEPLVEIFRRADVIGSLAVITEMPVDVLFAFDATRPEMRAPLDTPMIVVGGRFVLPPPHLERAGKAAKAAMDKARNAATARESYI